MKRSFYHVHEYTRWSTASEGRGKMAATVSPAAVKRRQVSKWVQEEEEEGEEMAGR